MLSEKRGLEVIRDHSRSEIAKKVKHPSFSKVGKLYVKMKLLS